jgi:hypothetical protein
MSLRPEIDTQDQRIVVAVEEAEHQMLEQWQAVYIFLSHRERLPPS